MSQRKRIELDTDKKLQIYMHPMRQKLLRLLALHGAATAKGLADRLSITPSSVQHHLKRLESIGLVELDHTQLIHGITARYFRAVAGADICIGGEREDHVQERDAIARGLLWEVYGGFQRATQEARANPAAPRDAGDMILGVAHLTKKREEELRALIERFVSEHESPAPDTRPWEFALVFYRAGEGDSGKKQEDEQRAEGKGHAK